MRSNDPVGVTKDSNRPGDDLCLGDGGASDLTNFAMAIRPKRAFSAGRDRTKGYKGYDLT